MALRFLESFDHWTTTAQAQLGKWTQFNAATPAVTGRFGSGMSIGQSNNPNTCFITLDNQATWIVGAAVKFGSATPVDSIRFFDLSDTTTVQVSMWQLVDGTNRLAIARGNLVTTLDVTDNNVIIPGVWHYIEWKVLLDGAAGTISVHVDGIEVMSYSGDTTTSANNYADRITFGGYRSQSASITYDDIYICDGTGGVNDDFLGDIRVQALLPNGNGNSSVLVGSDANSTDNYLLVDESTPNDDTDYVTSATPGDKDTYTYGNLTPTTGTVHGLQIIPWARKDDAAARSIVTVARHSGTEEDGAVHTLSTSYAYYRSIRQTKPGGGTWSISDVNAAEFGVKVNA